MTNSQLVWAFEHAVKTGEMIDLLHRVSMSNIPTATMGDHVFWNDLAECNVWRLQKKMITRHCRILDSNDIRHSWGIFYQDETRAVITLLYCSFTLRTLNLDQKYEVSFLSVTLKSGEPLEFKSRL